MKWTMATDLPPECPFTDETTEVDAMIWDRGCELGIPDGIYPDLVGPDPDWHCYWGSLPADQDRHRRSVEWRRKLYAELLRRPEWVARWRAEQEAERELNERIEALCEARGLRLAPGECPPWAAPNELPEDFSPSSRIWDRSIPQAVKLRRRLIAELRRTGM
jgi:hypothetical protein